MVVAAPKNRYEIAQTISVISVTILQIICWWGLIFDGFKDEQLISVYILKREPERIMTTVATLLPENFTIPPLIAMISINVCLIFCVKMKRFSWDYCRWIESKTGNFLKFLDNCGLTVCYLKLHSMHSSLFRLDIFFKKPAREHANKPLFFNT